MQVHLYIANIVQNVHKNPLQLNAAAFELHLQFGYRTLMSNFKWKCPFKCISIEMLKYINIHHSLRSERYSPNLPNDCITQHKLLHLTLILISSF